MLYDSAATSYCSALLKQALSANHFIYDVLKPTAITHAEC